MRRFYEGNDNKGYQEVVDKEAGLELIGFDLIRLEPGENAVYESGEYEIGQELESHMIAGGNWDGLVEVMNLEREESNFFRTLMQRAEESNAEKTEEKSEKKK